MLRNLSVKLSHVSRYKNLLALLWKYGREGTEFRSQYEPLLHEEEVATDADEDQEPCKAEQLASDLEQLGPTFVKLGQLLSTRPDFLPPRYAEALSRLQDRVGEISFEEVREVVREELGQDPEAIFAHFDPQPLAAASLSQVHAAKLPDGRDVVVKVQRPGIRRTVIGDLDALEKIADFFDAHPPGGRPINVREVFDQFRRSILQELNFEKEAQNLEIMRKQLREFPLVRLPQPIETCSSPRVLTMERIDGCKVTDLETSSDKGGELAEALFSAFLHQVLVEGFFHADPHPGNVFLTRSGEVALIDLGMTARLTERNRELLVQLLLAISEGDADVAAKNALAMSEYDERSDPAQFRRAMADLIMQQQDAKIGELQVGNVVLEITLLAARCGVRVPAQMSLLGKMLLNLDRVGKRLDPGFDAPASIRHNAHQILRKRMMKNLAPGNLLARLVEAKEVIQWLPDRLNAILEALAENRMKIHVEALDERELIRGFQKIANRITIGVILAAVILAGAMMMEIETGWTLFGYPGLAISLFLLAVIGAAVLVIQILIQDQ